MQDAVIHLPGVISGVSTGNTIDGAITDGRGRDAGFAVHSFGALFIAS